MADYEISQMKAINGSLPEDGALIKTIVTSNLADEIAKHYGIKLIEVLTGFKYIGQQILNFETTGKGTYLFGFEESYGCLIGTHARDKDAIVETWYFERRQHISRARTRPYGMPWWICMTSMVTVLMLCSQ